MFVSAQVWLMISLVRCLTDGAPCLAYCPVGALHTLKFPGQKSSLQGSHCSKDFAKDCPDGLKFYFSCQPGQFLWYQPIWSVLAFPQWLCSCQSVNDSFTFIDASVLPMDLGLLYDDYHSRNRTCKSCICYLWNGQRSCMIDALFKKKTSNQTFLSFAHKDHLAGSAIYQLSCKARQIVLKQTIVTLLLCGPSNLSCDTASCWPVSWLVIQE